MKNLNDRKTVREIDAAIEEEGKYLDAEKRKEEAIRLYNENLNAIPSDFEPEENRKKLLSADYRAGYELGRTGNRSSLRLRETRKKEFVRGFEDGRKER